MKFKQPRPRGRPNKVYKERKIDTKFMTPKGYKFEKYSRKNKSLIFKKVEK